MKVFPDLQTYPMALLNVNLLLRLGIVVHPTKSDGKIIDNWVMVDFPHVAAQLGHDLFNGEGWEAYDRGEKNPPQPEN